MNHGYSITENKVIIDFGSLYCETAEKLLRSPIFEDIVLRYLDRLASKESPIFKFLISDASSSNQGVAYGRVITLLRLLNSHNADEVLEINPKFASLLRNRETFYDFVEGLYNYWRSFERYICLSAPETHLGTRENIHHAQFIRANETLKQLVLRVYRAICENLIPEPFRVYRQLPAGAHAGFLTQFVHWNSPTEYQGLQQIPFIRMTLLEPPVIFYPKVNYRTGLFKEVHKNPIQDLLIEKDEWFCYPAQVGKLLAFAYFHKSYMSQGTALNNLFELAPYNDLVGKKPDIILIFGANPPNFTDEQTMFYHDKKNNILVGYEVHGPQIDYFGYMKKMLLLLHNIIMLENGRLPVHGAMVSIQLKNSSSANIVIVGDSGAGKSETLEAFRQLAQDHISEMTIVFDDMGSVELTEEGQFLAYGTEIGAFLRLDDLQQGYAFEQMDRAIFMNPNLTNARVIVPVTSFRKITAGVSIDYFLYANNYDPAPDDDSVIELFRAPLDAIQVFRTGKRMAKGTTSEMGLVESYYANPFGAPQRREQHERLASQFFQAMFQHGLLVGQLRTQLGIIGMEQEGPRLAAKALFKLMGERSKFLTREMK